MTNTLWLLILFMGANAAWGSGYEKSIMWGGRSAGLAGIATPSIKGSEALYFNPAGIVQDKAEAQDVSFNISPTWSQFKAPINNSNDELSSERKLLTPVSLIYARNLNDKWALAAGMYVSAGAYAEYKNVAFAGISGSPEVKTDLSVTEFAVGGAYRANESWNFGIAWRVIKAKAAFSTVSRGPLATMIFNVKVKNLEDTEYSGLKLGAQYKLNESTKLALTYRSEVNLKAKGTLATTRYFGATTTNYAEGSTTVRTVFPTAVTLGAEHAIGEKWRLMAEYVWTNYAKIDNIFVEGTSGPVTDARIEQHWNNQSNIRLASECTHWSFPVRVGYVWTSQVTRNEYARSSFTPPGQAHTLTLGTGKSLAVGANTFDLNAGLEYTVESGEGHGYESGSGTTSTSHDSDIRSGKFSVKETALHLGVSYIF